MAAAGLHGPDVQLVVENSPNMPKSWLTNPPPPMTFTGVPPNLYQPTGTGFSAQFNGINSIVYAFSGALLFMAFLSEMRHPMDFWKGVLLAQVFITFVYLLFGLYVSRRIADSMHRSVLTAPRYTPATDNTATTLSTRLSRQTAFRLLATFSRF